MPGWLVEVGVVREWVLRGGALLGAQGGISTSSPVLASLGAGCWSVERESEWRCAHGVAGETRCGGDGTLMPARLCVRTAAGQ